MKLKIRTLSIAILFLLSFPLFAAQNDPLWEKRTDAQIAYHTDLSNLLLEEIPEAKELILIQRDLQITMIKIRKIQYYYLLENDPSRIIRNKGQSVWANFQCDNDDEKRLLELNEDYRNLNNKNEDLKKKNQDHPMWPQLREKFSGLRKSKQYRHIKKQLIATIEEIDGALKDR